MNSSPVVARGAAALLLCALPWLSACNSASPPQDPPRPVLTERVGAGDAESDVPYAGEVRSRYETQLGFRVPGKISTRLVDAGSVVKAGQALATLDPSDLALNAAAATAQLELAEADVRRFRELRSRQFVSQAALDAKETAYRAARAQADLARNQTAYATLRADHDGVVAQVLAEVGQVVSAGQGVLRLARADAPEVAIAVPESRVRELRPGMAAEVSLWAEEGARYAGELRELATVADAQTRTYAARVKIKAPDARVLLGMTASVRFATADAPSQSLSVPLGAVFQKDGKPALWIVDAEQALVLRPVEVLRFGERSAVLAPGERGGVRVGERIVVAGVHKLRAGEKIKAVERQPATER